MRLTVRAGHRVVVQKLFHGETITIGSLRSSSIHLPDMHVARQHAVLYPEGRDWLIKSGSAEFEVRVNGRQILQPRAVLTGDIIGVGSFEIDVDTVAESNGANDTLSGRVVVAEIPSGATVRAPTTPVHLRSDRMATLAEFAARLHEVYELPALFDQIRDGCLEYLDLSRVYLGLRTEATGAFTLEEGRTRDGRCFDLQDLGKAMQTVVLERRSRLLVGHNPNDKPPNALCVPIADATQCLGILYGEAGPTPLCEMDLDFAAGMGSIAASAIQRLTQRSEALRRQADLARLAAIRDAQTSLCPASLPHVRGWSIAGFREPGRRDVGDAFDLLRLQNEQLALMIAHVRSINGAPALLGQVRAAFRVGQLRRETPDTILRQIQWLVGSQKESSAQIDILIVNIEPEGAKVKFASAGDTLGWMFDAHGDNKPIRQEQGTISAGNKMTCATAQTSVPEGGALFLTTSGAWNLRSEQGKLLGVTGLLDRVAANLGDASPEAMRDLLDDLKRFAGCTSFDRDLTMLLLQPSRAGQSGIMFR